jgi:phosphoglycerate dehydrogenase-like enzyme
MKVVLNLQYGYYFLNLTQRHVDSLELNFPQINFVNLEKEDNRLLPEIQEADAFVTWPIGLEKFKNIAETARNLKWIQFSYTGVSQEYLEIAKNRSWISTNAKGIASESVSLHALSLLLVLERNLHLAFQQQQEKKWNHHVFTEQDYGFSGIRDKTLGIVGLGSIGEKLAAKAAGLGMRVLGIKKNFNKTLPYVEKILPPSQISTLLKESDALILCAPLLKETRCLLRDREFDQMKRTAFLINVARGGLIDESALIEALQQKKIAGAALDVVQEEPLAPDSPLYRTPRLILTPHTAGLDRHYTDSLVALILENLKLFSEGNLLINQIDYSKGY